MKMSSSFSVVAEPMLDLVRIDLSGFFQPADITAFQAARNDAHRQLKCKANQHLTLVNITGMQIQSQETVEAFRALLMDPTYTSKRIAIVVSKTLARMQIERAAAGRNVSFFTDDIAAARLWLLA
jgi:hypothetical protein